MIIDFIDVIFNFHNNKAFVNFKCKGTVFVLGKHFLKSSFFSFDMPYFSKIVMESLNHDTSEFTVKLIPSLLIVAK